MLPNFSDHLTFQGPAGDRFESVAAPPPTARDGSEAFDDHLHRVRTESTEATTRSTGSETGDARRAEDRDDDTSSTAEEPSNDDGAAADRPAEAADRPQDGDGSDAHDRPHAEQAAVAASVSPHEEALTEAAGKPAPQDDTTSLAHASRQKPDVATEAHGDQAEAAADPAPRAKTPPSGDATLTAQQPVDLPDHSAPENAQVEDPSADKQRRKTPRSTDAVEPRLQSKEAATSTSSASATLPRDAVRSDLADQEESGTPSDKKQLTAITATAAPTTSKASRGATKTDGVSDEQEEPRNTAPRKRVGDRIPAEQGGPPPHLPSAATATNETITQLTLGNESAAEPEQANRSPADHDTAARRDHAVKPVDGTTPSEAKTDLQAGGATAGTSGGRGHGLTRVERTRFVQRVANAFRAARDQGGSLRVRLSPPELGSLRLEMTLRKGLLTARLEAETTMARKTLLDNLPALRERLAEQNIKVEQFEVDLMDRQPGSLPQHTSDGPNDGNRREPSRGDPTKRQAAATDDVSAADGIRGGDNGKLNVVV